MAEFGMLEELGSEGAAGKPRFFSERKIDERIGAEMAGQMNPALTIYGNALDAYCQQKQLDAQAEELEHTAKELQSAWDNIKMQEGTLDQDMKQKLVTINQKMHNLQRSMIGTKIIYTKQYNKIRTAGILVIIIIFFALLVKWVIIGPNTGPFIPGLLDFKKKGKGSKRKSRRR
jgi:hypothetical protein